MYKIENNIVPANRGHRWQKFLKHESGKAALSYGAFKIKVKITMVGDRGRQRYTELLGANDN